MQTDQKTETRNPVAVREQSTTILPHWEAVCQSNILFLSHSITHMSLPHVSLTPKNKLLHMSHIDSRAILVPVFSGEKNKIKINKHALPTYGSPSFFPLPHLPFHSILFSFMLGLYFASTAYSVSVTGECQHVSSLDMHQIFHTFWQLSDSNSMCCQGKLSPKAKRQRSFWQLFKFITVFSCGLNGARLAAQGHGGVEQTMLPLQCRSYSFTTNTTC